MLKTLIAILLSSIILVFQFGCKFKKEQQHNTGKKEFEGVVTYHEISKISDGHINIDDTVQLFYANGNYVNIHSDASPMPHIVKDYYFGEKPLRLFMLNTSDTLYQVNLNFPVEKLDNFKVKKINDQIFSKKCESIELSSKYPGKDSTTYTDFVFVFSRGYLNIDKEHFKNWNLGFFNKVTEESGAFYLKFKAVHYGSSHKNILSIKTYDVIAVKEQTVDPILFEIDVSKVKEYK
ncbi:hypothetical protein [Mucilaginibacter sp.]|uniref:hypothetical protein n=1 Tax=Mucilaginibacter sp. TaxID=1882438 RepID=UPI003D0FE1F1